MKFLLFLAFLNVSALSLKVLKKNIWQHRYKIGAGVAVIAIAYLVRDKHQEVVKLRDENAKMTKAYYKMIPVYKKQSVELGRQIDELKLRDENEKFVRDKNQELAKVINEVVQFVKNNNQELPKIRKENVIKFLRTQLDKLYSVHNDLKGRYSKLEEEGFKFREKLEVEKLKQAEIKKLKDKKSTKKRKNLF